MRKKTFFHAFVVVLLVFLIILAPMPIFPIVSADSLVSLSFDLGGSGVESGYIGVSATDVYSSSKGYGFAYIGDNIVRNVSASGQGALSDAVQFVTGDKKHTFDVDLPNGFYKITVTTGDVTSTTIFAEGYRQLLFLTGNNAIDSFTIPVTDGKLNLFATAGISHTPFSISKIVITEVAADKPNIWICGGSTAASYYNIEDDDVHGWGQYFDDYIDSNTYNVRNFSVSGMDAFTAVTRDYYDTIRHYGKSGDILLLSLSINDYIKAIQDNPDNPDPTEYISLMTEIVRGIKEKGVEIYLVKPQGEITDCMEYPLLESKWFGNEMESIAQAEGVRTLDLFNAWLTFCLECSYEEAKLYYTGDGLHLNLKGALKLAELVSGLLFPNAQLPNNNSVYDSAFDDPSTIVYQTEPLGGPVANPHKGFVMTVYNPQSFEADSPYGIGGSMNNHAWDVVSICNGEHYWNEVNPAEGVYDFSRIDAMLDACERHGMTYVIRMIPYSLLSSSITYVEMVRDFVPQWVYDKGAQKNRVTLTEDPSIEVDVPVWDDPVYLQACKDFATALAAKYDGDPRVEFIDISTFGNWGEWHFAQVNGSEMPSAEVQKDMILHYRTVFSNTLLAVPSNCSGEVYEYALSLGVAKRDNGLIAGVNREWSLRPSYHANVPVLGENYAPYWMMINNQDESPYNLSWTPTRFRECIEIGHMTITAFDQSSDCGYQFYSEQQAVIDEMVNRIGYNFTVTSAMRNGNKLLVTIKNTGVAPCYFDIGLGAEITDSNGNKLEAFGQQVTISSGTFHDNEEKTFIFEYSGTVSEDARICLAMYDLSNSLASGLDPTVRFDNKHAFPTNRLELREDLTRHNSYDFVSRLYTVALGRSEVEAEGMRNWINQLVSNTETGGSAARFFCTCPEMINRNLSNEDYVEVLYRLFFDRASDPIGKADWVGRLNAGATRESILDGFINSVEWATVCAIYGIPSGGNAVPNFPPTENINAFVERLYTKCLNRGSDPTGLDRWGREISNRRMTATEVAFGFFFSDEFIGFGLSNEEYVERLYEAFMDRSSDEIGRNDWLSRLENGTSREEVFYGFANSNEFRLICESFGIFN